MPKFRAQLRGTAWPFQKCTTAYALGTKDDDDLEQHRPAVLAVMLSSGRLDGLDRPMPTCSSSNSSAAPCETIRTQGNLAQQFADESIALDQDRSTARTSLQQRPAFAASTGPNSTTATSASVSISAQRRASAGPLARPPTSAGPAQPMEEEIGARRSCATVTRVE